MDSTRIDRRSALKCLAQGATAAAVTGGRRLLAAEPDPAVTVLLDEPIGMIKPGLYGQFAEHIGGVIYDGLWVGPDSKVPNKDGFRLALIEHVRRLGPVPVRWPGGCFADKYHWRDGT
jgi:alpha-L-arabinofuranosidase